MPQFADAPTIGLWQTIRNGGAVRLRENVVKLVDYFAHPDLVQTAIRDGVLIAVEIVEVALGWQGVKLDVVTACAVVGDI